MLTRETTRSSTPMSLGHCWGIASGLRNVPGYGVTCSNLDMALAIVQHPDASLGQKAWAAAYHCDGRGGPFGIGGRWGDAGVGGRVGCGGCRRWNGSSEYSDNSCLVQNGDCTNEINAVARASSEQYRRTWNPFQRGRRDRELWYGSEARILVSQNLPGHWTDTHRRHSGGYRPHGKLITTKACRPSNRDTAPNTTTRPKTIPIEHHRQSRRELEQETQAHTRYNREHPYETTQHNGKPTKTQNPITTNRGATTTTTPDNNKNAGE